ncbi:MAG: NUDIX hydrolase [Anaerolineae bacterium]|nr:NUDIX hydrolase [Anaerolineae bacterium]
MDEPEVEIVVESPQPRWLRWAKALRSLARAGLTYSESPFDHERYDHVLAIAAEMAAEQSGANVADVQRLFVEAEGYETPKVDVRGVVIRDGCVLLVRELLDGGRWTLPGGWADVNDRPSEAVEREVWEESGYRVRATKVLAIYDRRLHGHTPPHLWGIYKLFFACELLGGEPSASVETAGASFFAEDAIPELSLARVTPEEITRLFEHDRHPDWPTDFD